MSCSCSENRTNGINIANFLLQTGSLKKEHDNYSNNLATQLIKSSAKKRILAI